MQNYKNKHNLLYTFPETNYHHEKNNTLIFHVKISTVVCLMRRCEEFTIFLQSIFKSLSTYQNSVIKGCLLSSLETIAMLFTVFLLK